MGVVLEIEDTTLRRAVAIKFFRDVAKKDRLRVERFEREARLAAALNHPNVCVIFEVGRHEGDPFIAMELLEGRTLRDMMAFYGVGRPVAMDMVVEIAVQIADALVAAHAKGMVHRDAKADQCVRHRARQGQDLDFGLAKLVGIGGLPPDAGIATAGATISSDNSHLTNPAQSSGPSRMSPEQARGEDLDGRSDLFSFGALLYEMSAGQMAFQGGSAAALFGAILHETPAPLTRLNPQVPYELERIVSEALEKDRRLRFQTAGRHARRFETLEARPRVARAPRQARPACRHRQRPSRGDCGSAVREREREIRTPRKSPATALPVSSTASRSSVDCVCSRAARCSDTGAPRRCAADRA